MIKLIIFDIGGVLIDFTDRQYVDYAGGRLNINKSKFLKALRPLVIKMEYGAMTLEEAKDVLSRKFCVKNGSLQWTESYKKLAKRNECTFRLVNHLSKKYTVVLLSNAEESRFISGQYMLKGIHTKRMFVSCYLKMRKPAKKIYLHVLREMKVKPNEAVFIDNLKVNVDGAKSVGMAAIQYKNCKLLIKELGKMKIK